MPHAKDINNKSCFIETEVQIVFSVNMQITVWQTRFVADLENKMIVYTWFKLSFLGSALFEEGIQ